MTFFFESSFHFSRIYKFCKAPTEILLAAGPVERGADLPIKMPPAPSDQLHIETMGYEGVEFVCRLKGRAVVFVLNKGNPLLAAFYKHKNCRAVLFDMYQALRWFHRHVVRTTVRVISKKARYTAEVLLKNEEGVWIVCSSCTHNNPSTAVYDAINDHLEQLGEDPIVNQGDGHTCFGATKLEMQAMLYEKMDTTKIAEEYKQALKANHDKYYEDQAAACALPSPQAASPSATPRRGKATAAMASTKAKSKQVGGVKARSASTVGGKRKNREQAPQQISYRRAGFDLGSEFMDSPRSQSPKRVCPDDEEDAANSFAENIEQPGTAIARPLSADEQAFAGLECDFRGSLFSPPPPFGSGYWFSSSPPVPEVDLTGSQWPPPASASDPVEQSNPRFLVIGSQWPPPASAPDDPVEPSYVEVLSNNPERRMSNASDFRFWEGPT